MHLHQSPLARRVTILPVRRLSVMVLLVLAFLAAPLGAVCSACCPEPETTEKLVAAMPCCAEDCRPSLSQGRDFAPALTIAKAASGSPLVAIADTVNSHSVELEPSRVLVTSSPSPPPDAERPSSVLRL